MSPRSAHQHDLLSLLSINFFCHTYICLGAQPNFEQLASVSQFARIHMFPQWCSLHPNTVIKNRCYDCSSSSSFKAIHTKVIGVLLSFVQLIRNETWLHHADVNFNHPGSSKSSVKTFSSNCKLDNSPSPPNVLILILSDDKFLVYLMNDESSKLN